MYACECINKSEAQGTSPRVKFDILHNGESWSSNVELSINSDIAECKAVILKERSTHVMHNHDAIEIPQAVQDEMIVSLVYHTDLQQLSFGQTLNEAKHYHHLTTNSASYLLLATKEEISKMPPLQDVTVTEFPELHIKQTAQ